jgi:uncharacterized membrane protein
MDITIPNIPLPFEIPATIHPLFVHFAIALPVVIFLIEFMNLFIKRKSIGVVSFILLVVTSVVMFGGYLTGITDAELAKETISGDAKALLEEHKQFGIYLVYLSGVVLLFKVVSAIFRSFYLKTLFLISLVGFIGTTLLTGKKGGELVYHNGVNVKIQSDSNSTKKDNRVITNQNSDLNVSKDSNKSNK